MQSSNRYTDVTPLSPNVLINQMLLPDQNPETALKYLSKFINTTLSKKTAADHLSPHEYIGYIYSLNKAQLKLIPIEEYKKNIDAYIRVEKSSSEIKQNLEIILLHIINMKNHTLDNARVLQNAIKNRKSGLLNLNGALLSRADLQGVNLQGVLLNGADLRNANLENADLSYASLIYTQMHNINLKQAKLIQTDLSYSFLINADLRSANFFKSDFSYVKCFESNLDGCNLIEVDFSNSLWEMNMHFNDVKVLDFESLGLNPNSINGILTTFMVEIDNKKPRADTLDLRKLAAMNLISYLHCDNYLSSNNKIMILNKAMNHSLFLPQNFIKQGINNIFGIFYSAPIIESDYQEMLLNGANDIEYCEGKIAAGSNK